MEAGRNFGNVSSEQMESFENLGDREKNAVRVSLMGIRQWKKTWKEPRLIRVEITEEKPFNLRAFTSVMHRMEINITDTLQEDGANAVVFQPKPKKKIKQSILGDAIVIPNGLQKYFS